jgi:hypothetical protein
MNRINRRQVLAGLAGASIVTIAGFRRALAGDGNIELTARPTKIKLKGPAGPESALVGHDGRVPGGSG